MARFRLTSTTAALLGSLGFSLSTVVVNSAPLEEWRVDATNRAQVEYYDSSGNEAASPYPEDGLQSYDELNLNLNRRFSAYERVTMSMSALANDSAYRGTRQGGNLERARLFWEKGDGPVPIRLEAGDFYAYQSSRTIQTSLKGAQAEFQPKWGTPDHSIQVFSGQRAATYGDFDGTQPTFAGASWLMQSKRYGALSMNTSYGREEPINAEEREQQVASVAYAVPFAALAQDFQLETEFAYLQGDSTNGTEKDQGHYIEFSGRSQDLPLSYRASYADYGADYQPFGAAIAPDQQALDSSATWRFSGGRFVRGRFLNYRDGVETGNTTKTQTTGLSYGGPLVDWGGYRVFGNIDGFVTERENETDTLDTQSSNLRVDLNLPINNSLNTRLSFFGQIREDQLPPTNTRYLRQTDAALDYRFQLGSVSASVSPGVLYREVAGDNQDSRDLNPTLNGSLRTGDHALRFSYNSLRQEAWEPGPFDVLTQRASLQYNYTHQQHRLGVEGQYYDRQPDGSRETYASRVAVFWEYRFSKAAVAASPRRQSTALSDTVSVTGLAPGTPMNRVTDRLEAQGLGEPRREGNLLVFEAPVLDYVQRRQRLAYVFEGGRLSSTNLVIDFDPIGDGRTAERTFGDILGDLILQYGPPETQIEQGDFGPNLSERLTTGQFARTYQWNLNGQRLRFGIPSRLDGQVRMELRYADDLPTAEQNDWSLTELP